MKPATEVIQVTPRIARDWLKHNTSNRPMRPSHIENLRLSFERGEYVQTHQGVAFDASGVLIDGQHRLTAISLLDGGVFPMLVTRGLDRDTVFPAVDAVQAKRSTSDVLGVDRAVGETANFLAKLYVGRANGLTPQFARPFADWIAPEMSELLAFCPTCVKTWSSAPVRSAAVISMKLLDADYVKLVYSAMVHLDYASMPPVGQALCRAWQNGTVRASGALDIFARSLKLFDAKNAKNSKVQIREQASVISSVREYLAADIFGEKKKKAAPIPRAAKSVQPEEYRILGL